MICFGNVPAGSVLPIFFSSYGKTNGESITLTGLAVTDIEIYKGTSMTQRSSDAGFYAAGSFYTVVVSAVTIDSQTVNFVAATFRLTVADNTAGTPVVDVGRVANTAQTAGDLKASLNTIDDFIDTEIADIQARLPAALVGGKMDADCTAISGDTAAADNLESHYDGTGYGHVLQRTTIATLASQTSFTLTAGSADNDAYNGCVIVIQDASTAAQKAVGVVGDYTGSTKTVTMLNDPAVFTMATTDIVTIIADRAVKATVDNRTLDVSAGGEAGVDWANVGSPTTTVGLSGTTVKTATDVETDTADIQARLPAALVSGRMDSSIGAVAANAITAAGIADGAIDRATFAADTGLQSIRSNTAQAGAAGTITLDASASGTNNFYRGAFVLLTGGTGVGQSRFIYNYNATTKVADVTPNWSTAPDATSAFAILGSDGMITVERIDSDAITDDKIAAAAITSSKFAAGAIDAAAIATGAIDADAIAADAVTEIQSGLSTLTAAGVRTAVGLASANLDTQLDALPTAAENADAVWDESTVGHTTAGTFGEQAKTDIDAILDDTGASGVVVASINSAAITAASIATDAIGAAEIAAGAANKIADHVLRRTQANVELSSDGDTLAFRSLYGAAAKLVNKVSISGSTLTVTQSDDATSLGTQALTTSSTADPITGTDTA